MTSDVNEIDDLYNTPLHYAVAIENSTDIIEMLFDNGAEASLNKFNIFGFNPLHACISNVHKESLINFIQIIMKQDQFNILKKVNLKLYDLY